MTDTHPATASIADAIGMDRLMDAAGRAAYRREQNADDWDTLKPGQKTAWTVREVAVATAILTEIRAAELADTSTVAGQIRGLGRLMVGIGAELDRVAADRDRWRAEAEALTDQLGDMRASLAAAEAALDDARAQAARVRDLCTAAAADPGDANGGTWEDPTPIPGWTAAVLNALGDTEECE